MTEINFFTWTSISYLCTYVIDKIELKPTPTVFRIWRDKSVHRISISSNKNINTQYTIHFHCHFKIKYCQNEVLKFMLISYRTCSSPLVTTNKRVWSFIAPPETTSRKSLSIHLFQRLLRFTTNQLFIDLGEIENDFMLQLYCRELVKYFTKREKLIDLLKIVFLQFIL